MGVIYHAGNVNVPANDVAAKALAAQLRDELGQTHKVYQRGQHYLVSSAEDSGMGWTCVHVEYAEGERATR